MARTRKNQDERSAIWSQCTRAAALVFICLVPGGCFAARATVQVSAPAIEFTSVPSAARRDILGDPGRKSTIKGRVIGAQPGQRIVLYAHAFDNDGQMVWFVQPLALEPFTQIEEDGSWTSQTHPGSEYAALLVDPGFQPPIKPLALPTQGVVITAITQGGPPVWQSWWFPLVCLVVAAGATFACYRIWHFQVTRKLHLRFEERLAERTRVAQELHDTLLQGVLSASMQLHVAVDQLPEDSPTRPAFDRIIQLMGQVIDEGRNTLRGLRSSIDSKQDLKNSFSRIPQELGEQDGVDFRVVVQGPSVPLRSVIRDDVYSIGREAVVNAFRHARAKNIDVELEYAASQLRILVRDDGCGIDSEVLASGRDGHWGLSGMRERAERIGAKLKVLSRARAGTEVELRVPSAIAFGENSFSSTHRWFGSLHRRSEDMVARTRK
jgi:hypothetical protein